MLHQLNFLTDKLYTFKFHLRLSRIILLPYEFRFNVGFLVKLFLKFVIKFSTNLKQFFKMR